MNNATSTKPTHKVTKPSNKDTLYEVDTLAASNIFLTFVDKQINGKRPVFANQRIKLLAKQMPVNYERDPKGIYNLNGHEGTFSKVNHERKMLRIWKDKGTEALKEYVRGVMAIRTAEEYGIEEDAMTKIHVITSSVKSMKVTDRKTGAKYYIN